MPQSWPLILFCLEIEKSISGGSSGSQILRWNPSAMPEGEDWKAIPWTHVGALSEPSPCTASTVRSNVESASN